MTLLPMLTLFGAPDAVALDQPRDRKTFGTPHKKGDNRPRRKTRKKADPYRGPFKKSRYPTQEIRRPLVLPKQAVEIGLGADYGRFPGGDAAGANLYGNVGIGHIVELGVFTGAALSPDFAWSESIGLHAAVIVSDGKRLDFAPGLDVNIPTGGGPGLLVVNLDARHLFSRKVFLTFGRGGIPIVLGANSSVAFVGNVGVGVQASKTVAVIFETQAARLDLGQGDAGNDVTGIWETAILDGRLQITPVRMVDLGVRGGVTQVWDGGVTTGRVGGYAAIRF